MVASAALAARETRPPDNEELITCVHEVIRSVLREAHPTLEEEGISMAQFWALHLVSSLRSASVSAVARHLNVSAPTVCAKVDQLEAAGLVSRHRSARDHRAVDLALTPKGRRVEARVWAQIGKVMAEAARELPAEDVATAVRVFQAIHRRFDERVTLRGEEP